MPTFELTLQLTQDGVPMPDYPIIRRVTVQTGAPSDSILPASIEQAFPFFPAGAVSPNFSIAIVRPLTQQVKVVLPTAGIFVNPGGVFVLFDGVLSSPAKVTNQSASGATQVIALGGGPVP